MADDMTNRTLGKFISLEFIGMLLLLAVSWGSLKANVAELDEDAKSHSTQHTREIGAIQQEQKDLADDVGKINRKLDVLENNQEHFKDQFDRTERDVQRVLKILETRYPNGSVQ